MTKKYTIKDIAESASVSKGTVDRGIQKYCDRAILVTTFNNDIGY